VIAGEAGRLGSRAFDLLLVLAGEHERAGTQGELFDRVGPGPVVEENNLQVQVTALRRLLGRDALLARGGTMPDAGHRIVTLTGPGGARQPIVFLTDFVGCLPMEEGSEPEACLCADRNADDIEHVARHPWIRDRAIFAGNVDDVPQLPFGPGLPDIRDWTQRNFSFSGYALPFSPQDLVDTQALRARHGCRSDETLAIAAVGGTAVGVPLLHRIAEAFPLMRRQLPELRMVPVAGPRIPRGALPDVDGLDAKPYVHNLFEHLACCDLALVQGGSNTFHNQARRGPERRPVRPSDAGRGPGQAQRMPGPGARVASSSSR
jgi:hypothetical protein